jgi:hypothetical protein
LHSPPFLARIWVVCQGKCRRGYLSRSHKEETTESASFITIEDGDDLIVSFAIIPEDDLFDVKSLTLLCTPKYEFILDDAERGVNVSYDDVPDDEDDRLEEIAVSDDAVKLVTSHRRYVIDVRHVDDEQKRQMKRIFKKMNFDSRFKLKLL